jgi:hypothetical protein
LIRFRLVEDERRYIALRTELYLRLSQAGAPVAVVADVLRNLGKIESFAYSEGIRQGAVAAMVAPAGKAALDLHYEVYGHADTPLREVEKKLGCTGTLGVFEEMPLEFAPLTLGEAKKYYTEKQAVEVGVLAAEVEGLLAAGEKVRADLRREMKLDVLDDEEIHTRYDAAFDAAHDDLPPFPEDQDRRGDAAADDLFFDATERPADAVEATPRALDDSNEHLREVSSPDLLDRIRDELLAAQEGGEVFKTWEDLIMHLHLFFGIDAGALDLQLSTHEGRTVLQQAGLFGFPPDAFDMARFMDALPPSA